MSARYHGAERTAAPDLSSELLNSITRRAEADDATDHALVRVDPVRDDEPWLPEQHARTQCSDGDHDDDEQLQKQRERRKDEQHGEDSHDDARHHEGYCRADSRFFTDEADDVEPVSEVPRTATWARWASPSRAPREPDAADAPLSPGRVGRGQRQL